MACMHSGVNLNVICEKKRATPFSVSAPHAQLKEQ